MVLEKFVYLQRVYLPLVLRNYSASLRSLPSIHSGPIDKRGLLRYNIYESPHLSIRGKAIAYETYERG
jgi:hypothetical protein